MVDKIDVIWVGIDQNQFALEGGVIYASFLVESSHRIIARQSEASSLGLTQLNYLSFYATTVIFCLRHSFKQN
ncbi:MAG: hypothetical protein KME49_07870 [Brasilonema octagenarum HA4186-MV1]|nr:hypothetical protein [Brasilonema octagenarum HA4186-MV1]